MRLTPVHEKMTTAANRRLSPTLLSRIAEAITNTRSGTVHITIHDSQVVQIEKSEKIRMPQDPDLTSGGDHAEPSRADRNAGGSGPVFGR